MNLNHGVREAAAVSVGQNSSQPQASNNDAQPVIGAALQALQASSESTSPPKASELKTTDLTAVINASIAKMQGKMNDFTREGHEIFDTTLTQMTRMIEALKGAIEHHNKGYQRETSQAIDPKCRLNWANIKEEEQQKVSKARDTLEKFKRIFNERISALQTEIHKRRLERALLKVTLSGSTTWGTYLSSFIINQDYFGSAYRLAEIKEVLKKRKEELSDKAENPDAVLSPKYPVPDSLRGRLAALSKNLNYLMEQAKIVNEAFTKEAWKAAKGSEFPQQFYRNYMDRLEACKATMEPLKVEAEARLKEMPNPLSTGEDNSSFEHEKVELLERLKYVVSCEKETRALLEAFRNTFGFGIEKNPQLTDFGQTYSHILDWLSSIISLREEVVLGNSWEHLRDLLVRKANYCKEAEELAKLEKQQTEYKLEVEKRTQDLIGIRDTCNSWISSLATDLSDTEEKFKLLEKAAKVRDSWKV